MRYLLIYLFFAQIAFANTVHPNKAQAHIGSSALDFLVNDKELSVVRPEEFVAKNTRFKFTSTARDSARVYSKMLPKEDVPTFVGIPLVESIIRFNPAGNEVTLVVYSIGDIGEISESNFDKIVEELTKKLSQTHGRPITTQAAASSIVRAKSLAWKCPAGLVSLEWSSTRANSSRGQAYRAEFIRVVIGQKTVTGQPVTQSSKWSSADQLKTSPSGDKWIKTVPMVDQGQKGYCAVATSERVLRYYGKDADQHELAQACQTSEGTSADKFEEQMKRIASRFDLRFKVYLSGVDERFLTNIVKDYAKAGKKKGGIPCPPQLEQYPQLFYQALDSLNAQQFIAVRQADKAGLARMERSIRECIDRAEPIIWCVHLGIVPEVGIPQARGGHMRLIIGYNPTTSEIIYTDSWGPGHEFKRMKIANAWASTFGLYVMKPN